MDITTTIETASLQPSPTAADISTALIRLYNTLLSAPTLTPTPTTNATFTELVILCTYPHDAPTVHQILTNPQITTLAHPLRSICSQAEFHLESFWTTQMLKSTTQPAAEAALQSFPYYKNYMDLARLELSAIASVHLAPIDTIAFIGSGPLPLSSLCFARLLTPPPKVVHNIDCDAHAVEVSSRLCGMLGEGVLTFQKAQAEEVGNLAGFGVVVVAGLVGEGVEGKKSVLRAVVEACEVGTLVVIRSARGLRTLLYQEVEVGELREVGLEVLVVVHPWNWVVNSVVVARVVGKRAARL